MGKLRIDQIKALLPEVDELRPLLDRIIAGSRPDPDHTWSEAGELETVGRRLVRAAEVEAELPGLIDGLRDHLAAVYGLVVRVLRALEAGDEAGAVRALVEAAETEEEARRLDRAETYAVAARQLARGLRDRRPEALALLRAARAARALGRLDDAHARYQEAWEIARYAADYDSEIVAAIGRGNVFVDRGLWVQAGDWYRRALERIREVGEPRSEEWQVCQNLSIVERRLGDLDASRGWLERAEEAAAGVDDPEAAADIGNGYGRLHAAAGDLERAEEAYREALAAARRPLAVVTISVNLGECLLARGRSLDAAELGRRAEEAAIVDGVVTKLPEVYRLLGAVAAARGLEDAFVFFERAVAIATERALPEFERAQSLEAYGRWELERGDGESGAARLREAARVYDTIGMEHERGAVERLLAGVEGDADGEDGAGRGGGRDPNEEG